MNNNKIAMEIQQPEKQYCARRIRKKKHPNKCVICERQCAVYHHYSVPSCNGCKHFFRRSVTMKRKYICLRDGNCDISQDGKCRACRLEKCFQVGMKEHLVQAQQNQENNDSEIVISNPDGKDNPVNSKAVTLDLNWKISRDLNVETAHLLSSMLYIEQKKQHIRNSRFGIDLDMMFRTKIVDFLSGNKRMKNLLTMSNKYVPGPPLVSGVELMELMEGHNLYKHMPSYFLQDLFLAIEFVRTLPLFGELIMKDKLRLLQHTAAMVLTFDGNFYDSKKSMDTRILPNGSMPILLLTSKLEKEKREGKSNAISQTFERLKWKNFCHFLRIIKYAALSLEEFVFLRAILVCKFGILEVTQTSHDVLQMNAERYATCLLRHLQTQMGAVRGAQRLAELLLLAEPIWLAGKTEREMFMFKELFAHQIIHQIVKFPEFAKSCLMGVDGCDQDLANE